MATARFFATFRETEETTEAWHNWLVQIQSQETEPMALCDITDVCASAKVNAVLHDAAGFVRGWVDTAGHTRLQ